MGEIEARADARQRLNPQHPGTAIADACIGRKRLSMVALRA